MRNKFKYIILLVCILPLIIISCENNLDPYIYGSINEEDAYATVADVDANITSLYHNLRQNGWGGYMFSDGSNFIMDVACTDEWTTKWDWDAFLRGDWYNTEVMCVGFYRAINPAITRCTYVLSNIEKSNIEENIKKRAIAEVRALRAFFMYDIYRLYGPVPMITNPEIAENPTPEYKPERPDAVSVFNEIETELISSIKDLPSSWNVTGRITQGAAMHYLLKLYMHDKQWQEALNIANEIIALNQYSLEPNYSDIFNKKGSKEAIFVSPGGNEEGYGNHTFVNILPGDFRGPNNMPVVGWDGHRMPWKFYDSFDNNDTRRNLALAKYTNTNNQIVDLRNLPGKNGIGALPLKYGVDPNAVGIWATNDKILDRYAEVLLYKAEALNELNGPNQVSLDILNEIRRRAFGDGVSVIPGETVFEENFDKEIIGEKVGQFLMKNFDANNADWIYNIADNENLAASKALHIKVGKSGPEFWALQIRNENFIAEAGKTYKVTLRVLATKDINFDVRFEKAFTYTKNINVKANIPQTITFETSQNNANGESNFMFTLGNSGTDYEVWIDDVKVETLPIVNTDNNSSYLKKLSDFQDKNDFREAILQERGWEFWYEGKRREDLIRMNKYLEVGKAYSATNFSEKNFLFPIPIEIINENPKIKQNPGY